MKIVKENGKFGLVNDKCKCVAEIKYDEIIKHEKYGLFELVIYNQLHQSNEHILVDENMHEIAKVYIWQNHNDKSSKKDPYSVDSYEDYKAVYAKGPENNKQYDKAKDMVKSLDEFINDTIKFYEITYTYYDNGYFYLDYFMETYKKIKNSVKKDSQNLVKKTIEQHSIYRKIKKAKKELDKYVDDMELIACAADIAEEFFAKD